MHITTICGIRFAPTRQRGWLWRFWNRKRAWCLTPPPRRDLRSPELARRGDELAATQSAQRVLAAWRRRHLVDADGVIRRSLYLPSNVIPLPSREKRPSAARSTL